MCQEGVISWLPNNNMQALGLTNNPTNYYNSDSFSTEEKSLTALQNSLFDSEKVCSDKVSIMPPSENIITCRVSNSACSSSSSGSEEESDGGFNNFPYDVPRKETCPVLPVKTRKLEDSMSSEKKLRVSLYTNVNSKWSSHKNSCTKYDIKADSENKLNECGFYYGNLSMKGATSKLKHCTEGTYLLRTSSHKDFAYCLSIKTCRGTTSVRIRYQDDCYQLDSECDSPEGMKGFDCVLDLVDYYADLSAHSTNNYVFLESTGRRDTPVHLKQPFLSSHDH